jgi:hypothetical protein
MIPRDQLDALMGVLEESLFEVDGACEMFDWIK